MRHFNDALASFVYQMSYREVTPEEFAQGEGWTLSSGIRSRYYFNLRPLTMFPVGLHMVAARLGTIAPRDPNHIDHVGGLEVGAIPIVCALVSTYSTTGFYVRKTSKTHGEVGTIEGFGPRENARGRTCWLVEDVSTTGSSLEKCVVAARDMGLCVLGASSIIDRGMGAIERMRELDVPYRYLFSSSLFTDEQGA